MERRVEVGIEGCGSNVAPLIPLEVIFMVYTFKSESRLPQKYAQAAGEMCARLESDGGLTPARLVDANRADDAPLHGCFEWDDTVAAERYRETQAGHIIRSIVVEVKRSKEPTRAFVSIARRDDGQARDYQSIDKVLKSRSARDMMLDQAKSDMIAFQRKYRTLGELAGVFTAMDGAVAQLSLMEAS